MKEEINQVNIKKKSAPLLGGLWKDMREYK